MAINWEIAQIQLMAYMLVFCRMAGVVLFNPLLSRRNIPVRFSSALCLCLSIVVTPLVAGTIGAVDSPFYLLGAVSSELLVGLVWGLIFQTFYYLLFMAGDAIDMGMGLSMAKVFDSSTNIQMSVSGNLFNLFFVMFIFATNSHLSLIRLAVSSYSIIGVGGAVMSARLGGFIVEMFLQVISLVIKLCLPFLAATFTVEIAMGILMKLVPQINVFSIHFQAKVIMGLILLYAFAVPVGNYIDNYITIMYREMGRALFIMI